MRQLYYFTNDQVGVRTVLLLTFNGKNCRSRGLRGEDCKELLPVVLRINKGLAKVWTTTSVPLEQNRLSLIDLESGSILSLGDL